jgi:hypothetical protein
MRTQLITEEDVNTTVSVESENFDPRATVIINNLKPEVKTKDSKASSGNLKATVRDVPEELIVDNKDCYRRLLKITATVGVATLIMICPQHRSRI